MAAEREMPMSVCILFFVAVLFPFVVLPVLAIFLIRVMARVSDSSASEQIWQDAFGKAFSVLSITLAFDPDHALVWETQIPILQLISIAEPHGISVRRLHRVYLESARCYPELYEGSSFKRWLEFLERVQLVACIDRRHVLLTAQGREFLHYRITADEAMALSSLGQPQR
jgi:hypothetical protein